MRASVIWFACLLAALCSALPAFAGSSAHDWLVAQQTAAGFVDSYEGDNSPIAYTYDQALAIVAFTAENDAVHARKILDAMSRVQNVDGSWYDAYRSNDSSAATADRLTGNSLWMIIAINYYTLITGDGTYVDVARRCADYCLTMQEMDPLSPRYGSFSGGYSGGVPNTWTSTEHNQDAYSAYKYLALILNDPTFSEASTLAYQWVTTKMWEPTTGHFYVGLANLAGTINTGIFLDIQSWGIASLGTTGPNGEDYTRALAWADSKMRLSRTYNGQLIDGYDYDGHIASPDGGVWFEGMQQMSVAYDISGNATNSTYFASQALKGQQANGGMITAAGDGPSNVWPTNYPLAGVAPTAWCIFCSQYPKVNPLQPARDNRGPILSAVFASDVTSVTAVVNWTTNEGGDSQMDYGPTRPYAFTVPSDNARITTHAVQLTGLTPSTLYHYRVRSKDLWGNLSESRDFTFTTQPPDTTPPVISGVSVGTLTSSSAAVLWTTDEIADSLLEFGLTTAYGSSVSNATNTKNHSLTATGLVSGTLYHFRVKSKDVVGNLAASGDFTFTTTGTAPPTHAPASGSVDEGFSDGNFSALGADDGQYLAINAAPGDGSTDWSVTIPIAEPVGAITRLLVNYSGLYTASRTQNVFLMDAASQQWVLIDSRAVGPAKQGFTVALNNPAAFISGGAVRARITSDGATSAASYTDMLTVTADIDTVPPVISAVKVTDLGATVATVGWTTNEPCDSQVEYGLTTAYGTSTTLAPAQVTSHSVALTGLAAKTTYHYRVRSRDIAGNLSVGPDATIITNPATRNYSGGAVTVSIGTNLLNAGSLSSDDDVWMQLTAVPALGKFMTDWYSELSLPDSPSQLGALTAAYTGHTNLAGTQAFYLYNWKTSSWTRMANQTSATSDTAYSVRTTDPASYLSSTGRIRVRINNTGDAAFTTFGDLVQITVEYK